jgi:hypothetical protein
MIRAAAKLMEHIGFTEMGAKLHKALDICGRHEKKMVMTGRDTSAEFGQYLTNTVGDSYLESRSEEYVRAG